MKDQFEREAFKIGLRKLLDPQGHFYVSDFDNLCRAAGVSVSTSERNAFALLHCVRYGDMKREAKEALVAKLVEVFSRGRDPIADAVAALEGATERSRSMPINQSEILRMVN